MSEHLASRQEQATLGALKLQLIRVSRLRPTKTDISGGTPAPEELIELRC